MFGYYLEVRNTYKDQVPQEWIRKQTLANAERYITQELKEYEEKIMGADEKILALETRLFTELVTDMAEFIPQIQINANIIARLDCLLSFAKAAEEHRYVRPVVADDCVLQITAGRHPVIETQLPMGEEYVPNDIELDAEQQQIMIITGPNMAGKSAPDCAHNAYGSDGMFCPCRGCTHRSCRQDIHPCGCIGQHIIR